MIKRARQIESLDGLRGIAILMVMFLHFGEPRLQIKFVDSLLRAGTALGGIGVDLFFVLSGFLITGILLDTRHCSNYWSSFYSRRALRIFPLYYAFLFFAWAVFPSTADPGWLPVRADWWLYPSYLSNWLVLHKGNWVNIIGHFWSLALEEQFYFVWPWILLLIKPKRLPWILGFSETALIAVRSWWVFQHGPSHAWGLTRIDGLLCGASAASIVRTIRFSPAMKSALPFLSMGLFAGFLAITRVHPESLAWALEDTLGYPLLALTFTLLLLAATSTDGEGGWLQWLLCRRVLTRTGKYAYGLYVFHLPLVFFIGRWTSELLPTRYDLPLYWDLRIFVGIALSYVIATLSYNYFEKPFLKLKDRFRPTAPAPRANKAIPATLTMTNAMRRE